MPKPILQFLCLIILSITTNGFCEETKTNIAPKRAHKKNVAECEYRMTIEYNLSNQKYKESLLLCENILELNLHKLEKKEIRLSSYRQQKDSKTLNAIISNLKTKQMAASSCKEQVIVHVKQKSQSYFSSCLSLGSAELLELQEYINKKVLKK